MHEFWEALASTVHGSFEKAESALSLMRELEDPGTQINSATSPLEPFDVPDTNLIIRSSDFVNFCLVSTLYPVHMVIPNSYDKVLYFLATWATVIPNSHYKVLYLLVACQKYEMASVQSFICAEVSRGEFPLPKGAEAFLSYAIAAGKGLVPEMENAARQTLDHLMTFEILREGYNCLRVGLCETLISREYYTALQNHGNCTFCMRVHIKNGLKFCAELENKLVHETSTARLLVGISGPLSKAGI
ncbi:hypothetical protein DFH94DRAFT_687167 [Russula ochroleuca]|uniref:Uncharacterized protein n=1 Tax=Russula ochroleuca TaxID=152965 RepID=A0A9P5MM04_9AGAM|nr:hypothetical protein DFH94DRAFT_687167 [Russula ochroleuca]